MTYPIVEIRWVDPASTLGWRPPAEDITPSEVHGVGFLVRETEEYVVICGHVSEDGNWADPISIPQGCVVKMWVLTT